ncbi:MAG: hypothetical protein LW715_12200, partial [Rhodobacter sp.]|nr:hypothetical protein [Rhodobacter sp.]
MRPKKSRYRSGCPYGRVVDPLIDGEAGDLHRQENTATSRRIRRFARGGGKAGVLHPSENHVAL